jgi:uncharacterized Zn finger protein (UPF0148 family)
MAYCAKCKFEYRRGVTRCPDCGGKLVQGELPREKAALPPAETESVQLCRIADPSEAEIVKAALAEAGILSVIHEHGPITARLTRVADGATHDYAVIYVTKNRLEEARRVLAEIQSAPVEWPEGMEPEEGDGNREDD